VSCLALCFPGQEDAAYGRVENFLAAAVPEFQLASRPAVTPAAGAPPPAGP
jgi:hypothetical protein